MKTIISQAIQAMRLGYLPSQLKFAADGTITETSTGRALCPFILAPIETEQRTDHTLIRIYGRNSNTITAEAIGLEGQPA